MPHPPMTQTLDWVETLAGGPVGRLGISKTWMRFFFFPWLPGLGRVREEKDFWL